METVFVKLNTCLGGTFWSPYCKTGGSKILADIFSKFLPTDKPKARTVGFSFKFNCKRYELTWNIKTVKVKMIFLISILNHITFSCMPLIFVCLSGGFVAAARIKFLVWFGSILNNTFCRIQKCYSTTVIIFKYFIFYYYIIPDHLWLCTIQQDNRFSYLSQ